MGNGKHPRHSSQSSAAIINTLDDIQDDILTHILSFLPIKEAFRTSVLSKRWISLCYSLSTLHFDDIQSGVTTIETWIQFCQMLDAIILSPHAQQQTLKTFHLKCQYKFWKIDHRNIIKWIEAAIQRCVEDLSLFLLFGVTLEPTAIFISKTLVVLKLCRLHVSTLSNCSVRLPLLKILSLVDINFDDMGDLNKILYGCPILEDLKTAYINASVGVTAGGNSEPSLSKLIKASIRLFDVPLRALSCVKFLTVTKMGKRLPDEKINSYYKGYPVFEDLIELRLFWFDDCIHDWDDVVKMLQNCPKLEALSISKAILRWKVIFDLQHIFYRMRDIYKL
ncbi:F-box/LRR-repeat protein [Trifolium pratense]|uniref:F-box/LRR-repeat protein n=1 Tax=Trifolium pratense TaxID=57577 RepID=A0A2K3L3C7_TRIPR|nr:F-box/LRR-repeat protein [Trifolium pratense]PNX80609.1 F-box/LRR-repeat protein [Trifolium pratense]PNY01121.1 F-box/LRR-repeat protein [Trifolium pratense]